MIKNIFKNIVTAILTFEAKLVLRKYKPKIIAVTGSVGKTSTNDAIFAVLSPFFFVRKGEKSYNSEIGIPLTILGVPNAWRNPFGWFLNIVDGLSLIINKKSYPAWLVIEVGSDRPGDIKKIAKWLKPDINVITVFPRIPVHSEFFPTPEAVNEEDAGLIKSVKSDGCLILNHDNSEVIAVRSKFPGRAITYGFSEGSSLLGSNPNILYSGEGETGSPIGVSFKLDYEGAILPVRINGVLGKNPMYSALAALATGHALGLNIITMIEALSNYELAPGRLRLIPGIKDTIIIDDTYNSSPVASETALEALKEVKVKGRKIAALGDMLELGKHSAEEHRKIGEEAGKICDMLITVGLRARFIAEGALISGMSENNIFQFENSREAGKFLDENLKEGDIVLMKGSQGTRMERAVEEVMAYPDEKKKFLCRQDDEWSIR